MIVIENPNPFSVLDLPTDATRADIVARGEELYDTAETEEERLLCRWAKEQLITRPQTRLEYEFFELPETEYEDPIWDRFTRVHGKKPVDLNALLNEANSSGIEAIDMAALLRVFLDNLFSLTDADIAVAIDGSPFIPINKLPLEVRDVIFG